MNAEVIEKIRETIKLNSYETRVWLALLGRGSSSAGELADVSNVPRSRCYDVLEGLEKKGFVFTKIGKPIKYLAVPPEEVLHVLIKQSRAEENRVVSLLDSIKDTDMFAELKTLYTTGVQYVDNNELSHSIVGKQNINTFLREIMGRAKERITIYTSSQGVKRKLRIAKKAVKSSIPVSIYAPVEGMSKKNLRIIHSSSQLRMIHIDNEELAFFITPEDIEPERETLVWFKSNMMSTLVKKTFT